MSLLFIFTFSFLSLRRCQWAFFPPFLFFFFPLRRFRHLRNYQSRLRFGFERDVNRQNCDDVWQERTTFAVRAPAFANIKRFVSKTACEPGKKSGFFLFSIKRRKRKWKDIKQLDCDFFKGTIIGEWRTPLSFSETAWRESSFIVLLSMQRFYNKLQGPVVVCSAEEQA